MEKTSLFYEISHTLYEKDVFPDFEERQAKQDELCFDILRLRRIARKLHRINENECNGWPRMVVEVRDDKLYRYGVEDEEWRERDEKAEERLQARMMEIAEKWGMPLYHQGDPRGWAIKDVNFRGVDLGRFVNG